MPATRQRKKKTNFYKIFVDTSFTFMHISYLRIIVKMRIFERKWNTTLKKYREIVHDIFLPFFFSFFFPFFAFHNIVF